MQSKIRNLLFGLLLCNLFAGTLFASGGEPVGKWISYDETGTPRSVVEIYKEKDELHGKIVKQLLPRKGKTMEALCGTCEGDLQNKPKEGMVIMTGLKREGDVWSGGRILDTDTGNSYNCKISLMDNGDKLKVRVTAFLGFGATLEWKKTS